MKKAILIAVSIISTPLAAYEEEGIISGKPVQAPGEAPAVYKPDFPEHETPVAGSTPVESPAARTPYGRPGRTGLTSTSYRTIGYRSMPADILPVKANAGVVMDGQSFGADLTVWYPWDPYFPVQGGGQYQNRGWDDDVMIRKTYHLAARVQFPNPTLFLPFASIGPGYQVWERKNSNEVLENGATALLNQKAGVQINLAPYFALTLQNTTWYMRSQTPDMLTGDHETKHIQAWEAMFSLVI